HPSGNTLTFISAYGPAKLNVPVDGSKSSGSAAMAIAQLALSPFVPPAIRTFPVVSEIALNPPWLVTMFPGTVKLPVAGSYTSDLLPPAIKTRPSGSKAAVEGAAQEGSPPCPVVPLPVGVKVPVAGS